MRISHICIHNYRSIKDLEITYGPMLVLLGENNAGKSNIMSAVEFALSSSGKPEPEDLFAFRDADDNALWVELTFRELTDQEKTTFEKYLHADNSIRVRKTAQWGQEGGPAITYNGYVQEPTQEWLQSDKAGQYTSRDIAASQPFYRFLPETGRITKVLVEEAQRRYINENYAALTFDERLETSPLLGLRNVAAGVLPDLYFIPAVRDLDDEAKVKSSTIFGRLLTRALEDMAAGDNRFVQLRTDIEALVRSLNKSPQNNQRPSQLAALETSLQEELLDWGVEVTIEVSPPDIGKIFELGTNLRLDDGHDSLAQRKGHGLQRAVLFGFVKAWAKVLRQRPENSEASTRRASESMIFAIEEPELFLHPQAQRSLAEALRQLSNAENRQIMLCSHSSHFVDLDNYRQIAVATKPSSQQGTQICQCNADLFEGTDTADRKLRFHMAYWVNPERGEMFFAKKVIFVEGETEKSLFPFLARTLDCYSPDVSIVDCGSKFNLPLYITIAKAFSIHYHVVHDEDPIPVPIPPTWDSSKADSKRRTYRLNLEIATLVDDSARITIFSPDFEGISGVSRGQGEKMGKALAALEHFRALPVSEYPADLVNLIRRVYG
jgi:putative ATP-dependent endonuclease of the OLD family